MLLNRAIKATCSLSLLLGLAVGCGKKAETKSGTPVIQDPVQGGNRRITELLDKQAVECENGLSCPSGIAKVVVVDGDKLRYCTGFLTGSMTVATSSSCLSKSLRLATDPNRCQKDVHIYFPRSGFYSSRRVACKSLLLASELTGKDATLWRNDVAYLELDEPVSRRLVRLSREGLEDGLSLNLWKVDVVNETEGIIRKEVCRVALKTYVNPISDTKFSPVATVTGCDFKNGNTGAPLLGPQGLMRGILSQSLDDEMSRFLKETGLLIEPLESIAHVSNAACLQSVITSDPVLERDCFKDMNVDILDTRRSEMLNTDLPYQASRGVIQTQINSIRPYFNWKAELVKNTADNSYGVNPVPECIKPLKDWIDQVGKGTKRFTYSMIIPNWRLMLGFDRASRLVSRVDDTEEMKMFVQFSPKNAWNNGKTEIAVWPEGRQGKSYTISVCPQLEEDTQVE